MRSGVQRRAQPDEADVAQRTAIAAELTHDFWDASPGSYSLPDSYGRPASEIEAYDALDPEDLSAEWLARATEAPAGADQAAFDVDDPAEIPADSMSMISDASRHAALDVDPIERELLERELLEELEEDGERTAERRI